MTRVNPWRDKKSRAAIMRGIRLAAKKRKKRRSIPTADAVQESYGAEGLHPYEAPAFSVTTGNSKDADR